MFILFYRSPLQTYAFLFENGDFFSRLAYRPHVSGENGHRKHIYSKTFSIDVFENAGHSFTSGWKKTKVFEYDDGKHHLLQV